MAVAGRHIAFLNGGTPHSTLTISSSALLVLFLFVDLWGMSAEWSLSHSGVRHPDRLSSSRPQHMLSNVPSHSIFMATCNRVSVRAVPSDELSLPDHAPVCSQNCPASTSFV